jgi:hypothetical protein
MHALKFTEQELNKLAATLESLDWRSDFEVVDLQRVVSRTIDWEVCDRFRERCQDDNLRQHIIQTLFHLPLKQIPLLINHKSLVIRAIAKWRLDIAR